MKNGIFLLAAPLLTLTLSLAAFAADQAPDCLGPKGRISVNNAQVLQWKTSTPNAYHDRARVTGTVGRIYPDKTGHHHFSLAIGPGSSDTVEIIFNEDFGTTPTIRSGMQVEACGDFINEFQAQNGYPASPDGAIVHWVHRSNTPERHPSGYLMIDGTLYGMGSGNGNGATNEYQ